ncbi:MAG: prolipoprotein diacylglyceryl transferase [Planctomycetota bacterium]|jgi:prolipoprotein diacylglyceryl transferase
MQYIIWNISPEIVYLGPVVIRWYGVLFASSVLLAYIILRQIFRQEEKSLRKLESLFFYVVIGTIVGARLGHCFFYAPSYYISQPLEILQFWKGGLASHGAALGILTVLFIFSRRNPDYPFLWLLDRIALIVGLNGFFIRLGNLFNSEIIGTPTTVPWAFVFSHIDNVPRHPVQLYESLTYGAIFLIMITLYRRYRDNIGQGFLIGLLFILVFSMRFILEFFKVRQAEYNTQFPLSTGQLLSIPFCIVGFILIFYSIKHSKTT